MRRGENNLYYFRKRHRNALFVGKQYSVFCGTQNRTAPAATILVGKHEIDKLIPRDRYLFIVFTNWSFTFYCPKEASITCLQIKSELLIHSWVSNPTLYCAKVVVRKGGPDFRSFLMISADAGGYV